MGIKTVPQPPYSPDLAPCDFWLFPKLKEKLRGCHYETIEMREAVTKVIDTLTQEDFHGAFQKLLEWYKHIAAGGDYFEGGLEFHMCTINKSALMKNVWKLIEGTINRITLKLSCTENILQIIKKHYKKSVKHLQLQNKTQMSPKQKLPTNKCLIPSHHMV